MKKKLLIFAVAGIALASCSSDETTASLANSEANEISFRSIINGATRAVDITQAGLTSFKVIAFQAGTNATPYINDVEYTKSSSTFTSETKYYWPAYNLDFFAFAPADGAPVSSTPQITRTAYNAFSVTPAEAPSAQADLVFAATLNKSTNASGIALNFRHAGSKICLKIKNSDLGIKYTVAGWKIASIAKSGNFLFGTKDGETNTDTKGTASLGVEDWPTSSLGTKTAGVGYIEEWTNSIIATSTATTPEPASGTVTYNDMILVPQTTGKATVYSATTADAYPNGGYIAIKLKAQLVADNSYVIGDEENFKWAAWPVDFTWVPGKKYTYIVDIADGGYKEQNADAGNDALDPWLSLTEIKFVDVTVDEWDTTPGETNVTK